MSGTGPWVCFHCGEVCETEEAARDHFGHYRADDAACTFTDAELRRLQAQLDRYRLEDTDLHREINRLTADHQVALRQSEELGYSRGLSDANGEHRRALDTLSMALGNPALEPTIQQSFSDALVAEAIRRLAVSADAQRAKL